MVSKAKLDERKIIIECIEEYRNLPALWDIKSKDYSNKIKKNEQYEQLLRKYREFYPNADKPQLQKKFNSLRTNFRKEVKRIQNSEKSGVGADDILEPTLWYFDEMKFLLGMDEPSTSQNTMQIGDDHNETDFDISDSDIQTNTSTITRNTGAPKRKANKIDESGELISLARKHLQQPQNAYDKIGLAWAEELQKMTPQQQIFAKKAVNDIMFEGQMGTLQRDSVQINCFSRTSTPSTTHSIMKPSPIYYEVQHPPSQLSPNIYLSGSSQSNSSTQQQMFARKAVNGIQYSVQNNSYSRSSTPYTIIQPSPETQNEPSQLSPNIYLSGSSQSESNSSNSSTQPPLSQYFSNFQ